MGCARHARKIDKHSGRPYYDACARNGRLQVAIRNRNTQMVDQRMNTKEGPMHDINIDITRLRVRRAAAFGTPIVGVVGRSLPTDRIWEYRQRQ